MPLYVLDSNTFIQAHRINYPMDVFPGFWNTIKQLASENKIISIDKVREEIKANEDTLRKWMDENLDENFFHSTESPEILSEYSKIIQWAHSGMYNENAKKTFMDYARADAWLISFCRLNDYVLVTQEVSAPDSRRSIKIPDACNANNVRWVNTLNMFRALKISL